MRRRPKSRALPDDMGSVERHARARPVAGGERSGGMGVFATVLAVAAILGAWLAVDLHRSSTLLAQPDTGPAARAVIFVIDGATPSDFSLAPMPHLRAL